jgi:CubicO group peptidase (beta-lactamase class C family)
VISGQPLDKYLKEHIFDPLHMDDTGFELTRDRKSRLLPNYMSSTAVPTLTQPDWDDNGSAGGGDDDAPQLVDISKQTTLAYVPKKDNVRYLSGGGGLLSTTADYLKFCHALRSGGGGIISPGTLALMTMNHLQGGADLFEACKNRQYVELAEKGVGFGLGFKVVVDQAKAATLCSPGTYSWWGLAGTVFFIDPEKDLVIVFMTQLSFAHHLKLPLKPLLCNVVYSSLAGKSAM